MDQMYEIEGGGGAQYPRDVVSRPVHQPAQSYDAAQLQAILARMAERGETPVFLPAQVSAAQRPAVTVDLGQVAKWLGLSVVGIFVAALGFVACKTEPPPPIQTVHKPSCVAVC